MQTRLAPKQQAARRFALIAAALAMVFATTSPRAQDIVCCNLLFNVEGNWIGASRNADCQKFLNQAPRPTAVLLCKKRMDLVCINTSRCDEFPPEEIAPDRTSTDAASLPPSDPDRDGLMDGFGGPPGSAPPAGGPSPLRLVYLIKVVPRGGKPVTAFTAWLDRAGCLVPIAVDNQPADRAAAKHVVRGRIVRGDGRVRIEAEASELAGRAKLGKRVGEAEGEDAAAVATATRAVLKQMKLACAR